MLGAFCQVQTGARHDHDWTNDTAGTWFWRPTSNRPESILILDATPRSTVFLRHGACIPPGGSLTA